MMTRCYGPSHVTPSPDCSRAAGPTGCARCIPRSASRITVEITSSAIAGRASKHFLLSSSLTERGHFVKSYSEGENHPCSTDIPAHGTGGRGALSTKTRALSVNTSR